MAGMLAVLASGWIVWCRIAAWLLVIFAFDAFPDMSRADRFRRRLTGPCIGVERLAGINSVYCARTAWGWRWGSRERGTHRQILSSRSGTQPLTGKLRSNWGHAALPREFEGFHLLAGAYNATLCPSGPAPTTQPLFAACAASPPAPRRLLLPSLLPSRPAVTSLL